MTKTHIVVHHSLTKDGSTVDWQAIRRYHKTAPEYMFRDIGYHFGVEKINGEYEVLIGRMPDEEGAHCKEMGMNKKSFGVLVVGDFDVVAPESAQMDKLLQLLRYLMVENGIHASEVLGHREVGMLAGFNWQLGQYKTCPGKAFDMNLLRARLRI